MIKKVLASGAAAIAGVALVSPASMAEIYANPEFSSTRYGDEHQGTQMNMDIGYRGGSDRYSFYVQGGPVILSPQGEKSSSELGGKFGGSVAVTEKVSAYGEVSGQTGEEFTLSSKVGLDWAF